MSRIVMKPYIRIIHNVEVISKDDKYIHYKNRKGEERRLYLTQVERVE